MTPLFEDELVAILPDNLGQAPKKVTPAFLAGCPLILGNESSALRQTITWKDGISATDLGSIADLAADIVIADRAGCLPF